MTTDEQLNDIYQRVEECIIQYNTLADEYMNLKDSSINKLDYEFYQHLEYTTRSKVFIIKGVLPERRRVGRDVR